MQQFCAFSAVNAVFRAFLGDWPLIPSMWKGCVVKANAYGHGALPLSHLYERLGFVVASPEFLEEGIPHITMTSLNS